VDFVPRLF